MSLTAAALPAREVTACASHHLCAQAASLADLSPGQQAIIDHICVSATPEITRRLHDLGFVAGATVQAIRRSPLGDPAIYRVADYEIALRAEQARCIRTSAL